MSPACCIARRRCSNSILRWASRSSSRLAVAESCAVLAEQSSDTAQADAGLYRQILGDGARTVQVDDRLHIVGGQSVRHAPLPWS